MITRHIFALTCCAVAFGTFAADPPEYAPMEAEFKIASQTVIDPGPNEKLDRVALSITGESAKTIYDAMPGPKTPVACVDDGVTRKRTAGGLECIAYEDGKYMCAVAIMLDSGETKKHLAC